MCRFGVSIVFAMNSTPSVGVEEIADVACQDACLADAGVPDDDRLD
jgi:hypothetical protein